MRIEGKSKFVKRAVFAACLLDVHDFNLTIIEDKEGSYLEQDSEGFYVLAIEKKLPKCLIMEHMAHEMVHLAQYVRGDLRDEPGGMSRWKGTFYPPAEHGSDEYYLAPWEMEARALQAWIEHKWETRRELY